MQEPRTRSTTGWPGLSLLILAAGALVVAGCGAAGSIHSRATALIKLPFPKPPAPLRAPTAHLQVLSPHPGQNVGGRFTVRVAVSRFVLQGPRAGRSPAKDRGHLQFSLDHGRYDEPRFSGQAGRYALTLGVNGYYSPSYRPAITYQHIPAGVHTLTVRLANRDESLTGTSATVKFAVH